jgi:beta-lactamase regulating signal transducer with metallopeptidase domain
MTDFLIESSATMLLLLLIYRLLLEREKMHRFNRFYLLFALVFSIAIPFISFTIYEEVIIAPFIGTSEEMPVISDAQPVATPVNYLPYFLIGIYLTVTLLLAFRFLNNLMHFRKKIVANPTVNYIGATLVLLTEKVVPHTFLHYIFINRQEYEDGHIEEQLFTHELAHVNQKHTIDVLFIELLKTVFWFNPLLYYYKKAIQLNHEFLADESVVSHTHNVISYQQLLLKKALPPANYQLASSLNFSLTKKRFTMMTKATPKRKALLLKLAALPIIAGLMFALCTETVAQVSTVSEQVIKNSFSSNKGDRDKYFAGVRIRVYDEKKVKLFHKPYEELTELEKDKYLPPVPKSIQKKVPSTQELDALKNTNECLVSIDYEFVTNKELDKYIANDFAVYIDNPSYKEESENDIEKVKAILLTSRFYNGNYSKRKQSYGFETYTAVMIKDDKTGMLKPVMVPEFMGVTDFLESREKFTKAKSTNMDTAKKYRASLINNLKVKKGNTIDIKKLSVYQQDKIYSASEVLPQPEFPGGISEFYKFVNREFKSPKVKEDITAKIYVSFVIESDGSMSNTKILKAPGNGMGEEAVRTLQSITTKWLPGKVEGKPVRTLYNLPIVVNIKS